MQPQGKLLKIGAYARKSTATLRLHHDMSILVNFSKNLIIFKFYLRLPLWDFQVARR